MELVGHDLKNQLRVLTHAALRGHQFHDAAIVSGDEVRWFVIVVNLPLAHGQTNLAEIARAGYFNLLRRIHVLRFFATGHD